MNADEGQSVPDGNDDGAIAQPGRAAGDQADGVRRARILAVDDDTLISMSTVELLEDLGYEVVEANSGEEALEILRCDGPIDLLLTDYAMPRMNGVELAEAARVLRPDLPVLVATGYAELPTETALDLPLLGKPYRDAQLEEAVGKLLRH